MTSIKSFCTHSYRLSPGAIFNCCNKYVQTNICEVRKWASHWTAVKKLKNSQLLRDKGFLDPRGETQWRFTLNAKNRTHARINGLNERLYNFFVGNNIVRLNEQPCGDDTFSYFYLLDRCVYFFPLAQNSLFHCKKTIHEVFHQNRKKKHFNSSVIEQFAFWRPSLPFFI